MKKKRIIKAWAVIDTEPIPGGDGFWNVWDNDVCANSIFANETEAKLFLRGMKPDERKIARIEKITLHLPAKEGGKKKT